MAEKREKRYRGVMAGCVLAIAAGLTLFACWFALREDELKIEIETSVFTESSKELQNPRRGFYSLYSFMITDEKQDYDGLIERKYKDDVDTRLTFIQICLQNYREGEITEAGLSNIAELFNALDLIDKQLIVRFVYDTEGEIERHEPENLDIIISHMEQVAGILDKHRKQIFVVQGIFIGNWGEMNGTQYGSDTELRLLADKMAEITDESVYLAVRTPSQWRCITQMEYKLEEALSGHSYAGRLGLFNDGMLGNASDYGTYASEDDMQYRYYPKWSREAELEFQEELCCVTPNGGEVIKDNPYNDFEYALEELRAMHVTYLNKDYDQEVLNKWAQDTVTEKGCFEGMDGYSYIEMHLGYRLLIEKAVIKEQKEALSVDIEMKNVGFAPIYKEPELSLIFYNEEEPRLLSYKLSGSVHELEGGRDSEKSLAVYTDIEVSELERGTYGVYFSMIDPDSGEHIQLANEEEEEQYGYRIGTVRLQ